MNSLLQASTRMSGLDKENDVRHILTLTSGGYFLQILHFWVKTELSSKIQIITKDLKTRLFKVLGQALFATSKTGLDILYQNLYTWVASRVQEQLSTYQY